MSEIDVIELEVLNIEREREALVHQNHALQRENHHLAEKASQADALESNLRWYKHQVLLVEDKLKSMTQLQADKERLQNEVHQLQDALEGEKDCQNTLREGLLEQQKVRLSKDKEAQAEMEKELTALRAENLTYKDKLARLERQRDEDASFHDHKAAAGASGNASSTSETGSGTSASPSSASRTAAGTSRTAAGTSGTAAGTSGVASGAGSQIISGSGCHYTPVCSTIEHLTKVNTQLQAELTRLKEQSLAHQTPLYPPHPSLLNLNHPSTLHSSSYLFTRSGPTHPDTSRSANLEVPLGGDLNPAMSSVVSVLKSEESIEVEKSSIDLSSVDAAKAMVANIADGVKDRELRQVRQELHETEERRKDLVGQLQSVKDASQQETESLRCDIQRLEEAVKEKDTMLANSVSKEHLKVKEDIHIETVKEKTALMAELQDLKKSHQQLAATVLELRVEMDADRQSTRQWKEKYKSSMQLLTEREARIKALQSVVSKPSDNSQASDTSYHD